jgi:PAS domain S-box-containing protein
MALIANLADAVFEFKEGVLVGCNDGVENIYGYTKGELIGKKAGFFLPKDVDAAEFINRISAAIEQHGVFRSTVVVRKKDESLADIEYVISRTKANSHDKVIVVARDITERKQIEKEKERLLAELAEKTRELEQIVYVTSHDLRSPLVNIQGFTRELDQAFKEVNEILNSEGISPQLRKKLTPIINEDIPLAFQYILTSSAKMDSLLSGLLRLSRLGRAALNIKHLDMNKLVAEVVASVEFQIKESGTTVEISDLPPCYGDETQINQVFSNLLDNALKFLNPKRKGKIKIRGKTEKEQVVYCVEDNGIGIDEKDKQVIFEIFRRLDPEARSGEGLGLTIVRKILDRHSGRVWVESEPGKGSKFFVSLPANVSQSDEVPIIFGEL